ncbi:transposase-like protein [Labrenzia sp. EL_208]|nr:transposase-like protein [Labrenzia sp. EL_132]MBG6228286.1 transposase-like protein [Labrenzia sp. EL_208]
MSKDQREIQRKLRILRHAEEIGHVAKTCRYFGVGRSSFYRWREAYRKRGEAGLVNRTANSRDDSSGSVRARSTIRLRISSGMRFQTLEGFGD